MSTSLIEPKVASAPLDESSAPYLISPQAGGPIRAERLGSGATGGPCPPAGGGLRAGPSRASGEPAPAAFRRERTLPARGPSTHLRGECGRRGRGAGARCGVALRQLPHHRGGPPRGPPGPAPRLRRGAAEALGTAPPRLPARLRPGPGPGRPHRQRAGRGPPRRVRPGVPGSHAPDDRRALGPPHDAPPGRAGEPAAASPSRCSGGGTSAGGPTAGRRTPSTAGELRRGGARGGRGAAAPGSPGEATDPYVVRLLQLFRDHEPRSAAALGLLEAELDLRGIDANEVLRREHGRQAGNQVSVGNCVISLRLLSALDWNVFFERCSAVEAVLRDDPAGVYPLQDFATRDRYRQAVEEIARGADADELAVARHAVELARAAGDRGAARAHVGFYLVDRGQAALKAKFGYRAPLARMARRLGPEAPQGDVLRVDRRPPRRC